MLYFVVKQDNGYVIREMTAEEMYSRIKADPALSKRLDRSPFSTQQEAEKRRRALIEVERSINTENASSTGS
jgi:hypothetical protein